MTPRIGKPVEVQALWLNALSHRQPTLGAAGSALAGARPRTPSRTRFWNAGARLPLRRRRRRITGPAPSDATLPAQPDLRRRRPAAAAARRASGRGASSTPSRRGSGRRSACASLAPGEPGYVGALRGRRRAQRDGAYHQGTVWPWLLGAVRRGLGARARRRRRGAKREARERFLAPLLAPPRRGRPRPRLRDRRRRCAPHAARLPVPGLVGRRGAPPRPGPPGPGGPGPKPAARRLPRAPA